MCFPPPHWHLSNRHWAFYLICCPHCLLFPDCVQAFMTYVFPPLSSLLPAGSSVTLFFGGGRILLVCGGWMRGRSRDLGVTSSHLPILFMREQVRGGEWALAGLQGEFQMEAEPGPPSWLLQRTACTLPCVLPGELCGPLGGGLLSHRALLREGEFELGLRG